MNLKLKKKVIIFDLGGGTFDITLLNIKKNIQGELVFEVELTDGDICLGGSDFDKMLIDYSIKKFCKITENDETEVRKPRMTGIKNLLIKIFGEDKIKKKI